MSSTGERVALHPWLCLEVARICFYSIIFAMLFTWLPFYSVSKITLSSSTWQACLTYYQKWACQVVPDSGEPPRPVIHWSDRKSIAAYLSVMLFIWLPFYSVSKITLSSSTWQRRAAAPCHALKWQKKYCGVSLRNAFLITIKTADCLLSSSNWQACFTYYQ